MATRLLLFLSLLAVGAHAASYCSHEYEDAMNCPARYLGARDTCLLHKSVYYCCRKEGNRWRCLRQALRNNPCVVFNPAHGTVFEVAGSEFKEFREYHFQCNSQFDLNGYSRIACVNNALEDPPPKCEFVGRKETEYVNEANSCSEVVSAIRICPANTRCDDVMYEYCEMSNGVARCCVEELKTLSTAFGIEQTYCSANCLNAPPPEPFEPTTEKPEEPTTEEPKEPTEEPKEPTEEPKEPTEKPTTEEPKEPTEEPKEPTEEPKEPTEEPKEPTEEPKEPTEKPTTEEPKEPTEEPKEPTEKPTTEEPKEPTEEPKEPTEEPEEPTTEKPEEPTTEEPETPPPPPEIICGIRLAGFTHGTIETVTRGGLQYLAFSCEPNYRLIGQSNDICFINQLGSGSNPPRCVPTLGSKEITSNGCPVTIFKEEECQDPSCTGENYCKLTSDKSKWCCRQRVALGHSSFGIPDQCEEECSDLQTCQLTDRLPRYCDMFGSAYCSTSPWMAEYCEATCQC